MSKRAMQDKILTKYVKVGRKQNEFCCTATGYIAEEGVKSEMCTQSAELT